MGTSIPHIDLERDIMVGMMLQFLLIFLVLSLALFIMMRFITHRLWLPFDDTLQKTEQFNLAQSVVPQFQKTEIKEFARLNNSLAKLMQKDKEIYRIQKEFTENASHELQTPISIIRSKLDLLMQEELDELKQEKRELKRQLQLADSIVKEDLYTAYYAVSENEEIVADREIEIPGMEDEAVFEKDVAVEPRTNVDVMNPDNNQNTNDERPHPVSNM